MTAFQAALPEVIAAWDTPDFAAVLQRELEALPAGALPLQRCLAAGSHVLPLPVKVTLLKAEKSGGSLYIRAGVFFKSTIAGCSCADDPTPSNELDEYGVLQISIDMTTATFTIVLVDD